MITVTAREVSEASGGELLSGSPGAAVDCVSTDTRTDLEGCLFVALKGEHFDGGDFAGEALAKGAAAVLAQRAAARQIAASLPQSGNGNTPWVVAVEDPGDALKKIASLVAGKSQARIVAITGSTGKTSTKDMLYALLSPQVGAIASEASFNNEVGVPLTLLKLRPETRVAVVEMGMQAPGEIAGLCDIAAPEIAVITNIGPAHLAYSGSLANIARGKAEIARRLPPHGSLVAPHGEDLLEPFIADIPARIITFGLDRDADIHPLFHRHRPEGGIHCRISCLHGEIDVNLPFAAHHHLLNFLAALGAYSLLGLPLTEIAAAAEKISIPGMRGEVIRLGNDVTLLNDCYNANPLSMGSSLEYLATVAQGRRTLAVLGDMDELGAAAPAYHRQVGRRAAALGIDCVIGVGELAARYLEGARQDGYCAEEESCYHFASRELAAAEVPSLIRPGDVVLVKASRFMKLEEVSDAIIAAGGEAIAGSSFPAQG
ncbi:MAG: UDP-N-acetylmuramoyl-tripeptide--D-alanyl-D-alanine ligase [Thermoleophilia bacterium]|nr:UDP-N-acetylmuramoyl-tripeptide--D-alanyl-D-alanine ligase [Thermoleophilia bacterium]